MFVFKCFIPLLLLCYVRESCCKPTENVSSLVTEGRGVGSTIWGWVTYPFSWWGSAPAPTAGPLTATTHGPYDNIEIAKRNLTIWCSDHTCTTMECDKIGCKNVTCSIYDTDVTGKCREYNTGMKPEEPLPPKPTNAVPKPTDQEKKPPVPVTSAVPITTVVEDHTEEHPLELEAELSSTVTEKVVQTLPGNKVDKSSPQNKITA